MTALRERLPNRRGHEVFNFRCGGLHYTAGIGRLVDGRLAEIFLSNGKCGSDSDTAARDGAVVASVALQHGVELDTLRKALMRDARDKPSGPLGIVLDMSAEEDGQ